MVRRDGRDGRTVAFGHRELDAGVLGQVPMPVLTGRALRCKARSAQSLDVEVAVETPGFGRTVQVALPIQRLDSALPCHLPCTDVGTF